MGSKSSLAVNAFIRPSSTSLTATVLMLMVLLCVTIGGQAQTVTFSGAQSTITSFTGSMSPIAVDLAGNIYTVVTNGSTRSLVRIQPNGSTTVLDSTLTFSPTAIAVNPQGTALYYIHTGANWTFPNSSTQNWYYVAKSTISGNTASTGELPRIFTLDNGWTTAYTTPLDLKVDSLGNVYVCDQGAGSFWLIPSGRTSPSKILSLQIGQPWNVALSVDGSIVYFTYQDYTQSSRNAIAWVYASSFGGGAATANNIILDIPSIQSGLVVDSAGTLYVGGTNPSGSVVFKVTGTNPSNSALTAFTPPTTGSLSGFGVDSGKNLYMSGTDTAGNSVISNTSFTGLGMGNINLGHTSAVLPLQFYFTAGGTLGGIDVLTEGNSGQEFIDVGTGTCTTASAAAIGSTCTVNVAFRPSYAGLRKGAVVLKNSSGAVIATVFVYGTGMGAQLSFSPAAELTLGESLQDPSGVAVDAQGNVFIADYTNNRVVKETPSGNAYTQTDVVAGLNHPQAVAVDGAGNLFIADSGNNRVLFSRPTTTGYSTPTAIGSGMSNPTGVAVDGSGNVFVADKNNNRILKLAFSTSGYGQAELFTGLSSPSGVAVDAFSNVYIANSGGNQVLKETLSGNAYTQSVVGTGMSNPTAVVVDGNGNLFIADTGYQRILKQTLSGSTYIQTEFLTGLNNPTGVAVERNGNIYVADKNNDRVLKENLASPTLEFAPTVMSGTSTDSPKKVTLTNIGNAQLNISVPSSGENPGISTHFTLEPSTCPRITPTSSIGYLLVGSSCYYQISFKPTTWGNISGSLTLTDNVAHVNPTLLLSAVGISPVTVSPATLGNGAYGQAYSVTLNATGGTAPYTFSVVDNKALPAGITLATDGTLSGSTNYTGVFTFTISAIDSTPVGSGGPFHADMAYTLTINAPTITVTPGSLGAATVGSAYNQAITASGGTTSYTYALTAGSLPPGLSLSTGGALSGTPTAGGAFNFTITATDSSTGSGPFTSSKTYTLTVAAATITIDPTTLPGATVAAAYNQTVSASGGTSPHVFAVSSGALPPGLVLNATTGVLSGTPTGGGNFNFTIAATDSSTGTGPYSGSQAYTLAVAAPTISLAPASLPDATVASVYGQTVSASGGITSYSYAITAGALPAGLSLSSATGVLSGTPTAGGTFNFTITATDSSGGSGPYTGSKAYTLKVNAPTITLAPASLPDTTVASAYSQTVTASGATSPYRYTITSGALPAGLSLGSTTGVLSGTPTAGGTFTFIITATDSSTGTGPYTASNAYTLTVSAPTVTLVPVSLASGTVASSYSQSLIASGGTSPYAYAVTTGALPAGLSLSPTGGLSGTPTAGGTFNFTITATDSSTGTGPYTASNAYTLIIGAPTIVVTPAFVATATVGASYSQTVTASGGTSSYNFAITAGALPAGISLNGTTGILSGTPTAGGTFNFTVTATDSSTGTGPYSGSTAYTLAVNAPTISVAPSSLAGGTVGSPYNQSITATAGTAPYTYAITAGSLPAGLSLGTDGVLSGTPTAGGTFNFTVTATDRSTGTGPYTSSRAYSLSIASPSILVLPTALPASTVASAYSQSITAAAGTAPYTYAITAGSLPAGLSLTSAGVLSGTPTAGGTFSFTVTATDSSTGTGPYTGSRAYSLTVNPPTITVGPTTIPGGVYDSAYSQTVTASGGTASYTFANTGSLPPGLTLSTAGVLSGMPSAPGTYNFTITATDSSTGTGPYTASQAYTVTIDRAVATVSLGSLSQTYTRSVLSATSTTNPPGLTVTYNYTQGGTAATPLAAGNYQVVAAINDPNYQGSANDTLVVSKAAISVDVNNASMTYGASVPAFTGAINGTGATLASLDGISATFSTVATSSSNTGTYDITYTLHDPNVKIANYNVKGPNGVLTIDPAPLSVTADSFTVTYNAAMPAFTGTLSGVLNGDPITVNYSTTATQGSNTGTYSITASLVGSPTVLNNYTVTNTPGALTIDKAPGTSISLSSSVTGNYYLGQPLTITATVTNAAGAPAGMVEFYDGATLLGSTPATAGTAVYNGSTLRAGTHSITAKYSGTNYVNATSSALSQVVLAPAISLNGSITAGSLGTINIIQGGGGSLQFQIGGVGTLPSAISLACTGLPATLGCQISPLTINPSGLPATVTVSVSSSKYRVMGSKVPPRGLNSLGWTFAIIVPGLVLASRKRKCGTALLVIVALALMFCMIGCGGGGSVTNASSITPPGTYNGSITATSTGATSISSPFTVVVQ